MSSVSAEPLSADELVAFRRWADAYDVEGVPYPLGPEYRSGALTTAERRLLATLDAARAGSLDAADGSLDAAWAEAEAAGDAYRTGTFRSGNRSASPLVLRRTEHGRYRASTEGIRVDGVTAIEALRTLAAALTSENHDAG